ncbi:hypothetical protein L1280_000455 [Deinococcus sp. HSC-46F16]|uniref:hypothetical protein n=1 Tax=Deinococcus sp. HSC-46F16 TaxID=2910968 RepID=UPI0020A15CB6|nr:hypothetical protein [Deinococcus sp. HSC-46F16]MCP2013327.1 hypothetical protein [Deinococcus sp. HSC-46F16]
MIGTARARGTTRPRRGWTAPRPVPAQELAPASPRHVAAVMLGVMGLMLVGGTLAQLL